MIRTAIIRPRRPLHWMLAACCAVVILVVTAPCAMALVDIQDAASGHDCPHCPPEPCHDDGGANECDSFKPADKPRNDSGADSPAMLPPVGFVVHERPPRLHTAAIGPPPARDGPRRHLILVTFNE